MIIIRKLLVFVYFGNNIFVFVCLAVPILIIFLFNLFSKHLKILNWQVLFIVKCLLTLHFNS